MLFRSLGLAIVYEIVTDAGGMVDVDTESYQVARDYMVRIGPKDFHDDEWLEELAAAGGLSREEFIERFGKFSRR